MLTLENMVIIGLYYQQCYRPNKILQIFSLSYTTITNIIFIIHQLCIVCHLTNYEKICKIYHVIRLVIILINEYPKGTN